MPEGGQRNTAVAAHENVVPDLLFQSRNSGGYHGLRDKQVGGSLVDRPCFGHSHYIF